MHVLSPLSLTLESSFLSPLTVFVLPTSFLVTLLLTSSLCVLLLFCPSHALLFLLTRFTLIPDSPCVLTRLFILCPCHTFSKPPTLSCTSMVHLLHPWPSYICPQEAAPCRSPHSGCPNLLSRITMHSRMAIRAPVLRPADDRNASPWHIRILPWRWHGHTRRVKVLVPLSDGSPPSQTTIGSS